MFELCKCFKLFGFYWCYRFISLDTDLPESYDLGTEQEQEFERKASTPLTIFIQFDSKLFILIVKYLCMFYLSKSLLLQVVDSSYLVECIDPALNLVILLFDTLYSNDIHMCMNICGATVVIYVYALECLAML